MDILKSIKSKVALDRLKEEKIYEFVLKEFEQGVRREGLWAKAIAKSDGNESKVKSLYIEYRAQSVIDESDVYEKLLADEQDRVRYAKEEEKRGAERKAIRNRAKKLAEVIKSFPPDAATQEKAELVDLMGGRFKWHFFSGCSVSLDGSSYKFSNEKEFSTWVFEKILPSLLD